MLSGGPYPVGPALCPMYPLYPGPNGMVARGTSASRGWSRLPTMEVRRRVVRLDARIADSSASRLFTDEIIGKWFRLPSFVRDDVDLMDVLREPLSRRICLAGTPWGPLLTGLEDAWSWLFYGRSWLELQVQTGLEARQSTRRR
jgi:hypothetical protein